MSHCLCFITKASLYLKNGAGAALALMVYRLSLLDNPSIYLVNAILLFISLFDSTMRFHWSIFFILHIDICVIA